MIDRERGGFKLEPWDWQYYAEKVRKAEYDLDEAQIKPYFELDRVCATACSSPRRSCSASRSTSDTTFRSIIRMSACLKCSTRTERSLALFYADYFKRDNKSGGAWMDSFVDQSRLLGTRPVIFNAANFTKPAPGQPALLTFDEVTTLFHEFGHALHGMFSSVEYPMLSGTNVPRDFVEFPSQFNEHWALDPAVFAHTRGITRPASRCRRRSSSRSRSRARSIRDSRSRVHRAPRCSTWRGTRFPPTRRRKTSMRSRRQRSRASTSTCTRCRRAIARRTSRTSGTADITAGYYAYLWAEVLDHDAFAWFKEHGGLTRENGQRYRDMILSRGGTADAAALYRAFRGREPRVEPLLVERGL